MFVSFWDQTSSGIRNFENFFEFGIQDSSSVASILFYFTSICALVKSFDIKNCIKYLVVLMPSYFYNDNNNKTWKSSMERIIDIINIIANTQNMHMHPSIMFSLG